MTLFPNHLILQEHNQLYLLNGGFRLVVGWILLCIAIQSFFINTLTNFVVQSDTITAAACEEAHCEAGNPGDFVFCSGANRRRMNVTSSISRPGAQQCSIVDVDWAELFPEPHLLERES